MHANAVPPGGDKSRILHAAQPDSQIVINFLFELEISWSMTSLCNMNKHRVPFIIFFQFSYLCDQCRLYLIN
jgi:hypothetical protein